MDDVWTAEEVAEYAELIASIHVSRHGGEKGSGSDPRSYRENLGRFATGVVLITSLTPRGPVGMAVNSFTSVSLDPPLVSFCPMSASETWAGVREVGHFGITMLRSDHQDVSTLFARRGAEKFGSHAWTHTPAGHPTLPNALGWIDATIEHVHPAGDHDLVIARAEAWSPARSGDPLVFFSGQYRHLASA